MKLKLAVYCLFFFLFTACEKRIHFQPSENKAAKNFDLSSFDTLYLYDDVDLILAPDNKWKAKIVAPENCIDDIQLKNGISSLEICNQANYIFSRYKKQPPKVILYTPVPPVINFHGSGKIANLDTLFIKDCLLNISQASGRVNLIVNAQKLWLQNSSGTCNIEMSGKTKNIVINNYSYAPVDCQHLTASKCHITSRSINSITVYCTQQLKVSIEHSGNVFYKGFPDIRAKINGSGKLIPLN